MTSIKSSMIVLGSCMLSICSAVLPAAAEALKLTGSIDNHYAVEMTLTRAGQSLEGSYSYTSVGTPLSLRGTIDKENMVVLDEFDPKGTKTGTFNGRLVSSKRLIGQWSKQPKKALPFVLAAKGDKGALDGGKDGIVITQRVKKTPNLNVKITPPIDSTISYPVVATDMLDNEAVAKQIQASLSPKQIYGTSVDDMLSNVNEGDHWLYEASYKIGYNSNYLVDGDFTVLGSAAYPSRSTQHLLIYTKTGFSVKPRDVFVAQSMSKLRMLIRKKMSDEVTKTIKEHKTESNDIQSLKELFNAGNSADPLQHFAVSDSGLTFLHDWEFPHVATAWQPPGRYFFSYEILKPFIREDGPLAVFLK